MSLCSHKFHSVIKLAFLSGKTLVSDYGSKGEDNKFVTMRCDNILYIYKTLNSSHLKKL